MSDVFLIVVNGHVFKLDIHPGRNVAKKFRESRLTLHIVSTAFILYILSIIFTILLLMANKIIKFGLLAIDALNG